jgi:hypothetical protein
MKRYSTPRHPVLVMCCAAMLAMCAAPGLVTTPALAATPSQAAGPSQAAVPASAAGVLACRDIADNTARLACFDRESTRLAGTLASTGATASGVSSAAPVGSAPNATAPGTPAGSPATSVAAAPTLDPQQTFGLSSAEISSRQVAAGQRPRDANSITAHIARMTQAANARFVFVLDNQQVWQQLLAEGDLDSKPGDTVVISRALLGSYWMKAQSGRGCKVRRLR